MSDEKKPRPMTPKMFLKKAEAKISASAFIEAHREWLLSGELAPITAPILARIGEGVIGCKQQLVKAVFAHMVEEDSKKASAKNKAVAKSTNDDSSEEETTAAYTVAVFADEATLATYPKYSSDEATGEVSVEWKPAVRNFKDAGQASRWANKVLFEQVGIFAKIIDNRVKTVETVKRPVAIQEVLITPKGLR